MKTSKFIRIDNNILIEYIYDDSNLISEEYVISKNLNTGVNSFLSTLPETKNYISQKSILVNNTTTTKLFTNQLVKINETQNQWGKFDPDAYSFIRKIDYGISIPIRYEKIRVWTPVNYVFEDYKGFHLRVYTLDFNNEKWIDFSNYFFDISDVNQSDEVEYSNPPIYQFEMNWGKYYEIQFPSPNKVSDQRVNNVTKSNTINYNLTDGVGVSKDAPVFLDFYFIESIRKVNQNKFYNLVNKQSLTLPSTAEFEKFSIVIEPSTQGDFFLIYPEKNGSIGEFNQFIEESIQFGNRYYLEWIIEVYEKNIKVDEQKLIITENFIEEIEFRPILKYSTTSAIIDVTCKLIDSVNEHEIIRRASYALLQDEVSNYSRYLSKIDLSKAQKIDVFKIKGIETPNLDSSTYQQSNLKINTNSYVVYARNYFLVRNNSNINYLNKVWKGNRQEVINIFPYDNILKFNIISKNEFDNYRESNFLEWSSFLLTFKSDNKDIEFNIWEDSDENNFELGKLVFKVDADKTNEIKKIYNAGFRSFYISGTYNNNKEIIYVGYFNHWETNESITNLSNLFDRTRNAISAEKEKTKDESELRKIKEIKDKLIDNSNIQTSTITTGENQSEGKKNLQLSKVSPQKQIKNLENEVYRFWDPYWRGSLEVMLKSYEYNFDSTLKYKIPSDLRLFGIKLTESNILSEFSLDKLTGSLDNQSQKDVDLILSYFKIYNFSPEDESIISYLGNNKTDLINYLNSNKVKPSSEVIISSNVPPNQEVITLIKNVLKKSEQLKTDPKLKRIQKSFDLKVPFKNNNNNNNNI